MMTKNRIKYGLHLLLWISGFLIINFSGQIHIVGVFNTQDQSLLIPAIYGMILNMLIFYGNSEFLLPAFLLKRKVGVYFLFLALGFGSIITLDSTLDFFYFKNFYGKPTDYGEVITGNAIIDFFFILTPSFLYRFGSDWFKNQEVKPKNEKILSIKSGGSVYKIPIDDILYIESDGNYVKYHYNANTLLVRESLSKVDSELPENEFVRCHKSFIISRRNTSRITYDTIYLGEIDIPIGRSYREVVKSFFA